ncbi:MAG: flagellar assembly protein FliX [Rhodospirillales bacterium]
MKSPFIGSVDRLDAPQRKRRSSGAGGTGFARHLVETTPDPAASPVAETTETLPLDALLALQGVGEGLGDGRQASQRRGATLLDLLDRLRADLLAGRVAESHLVKLAGLVRDRAGASGDARLDQVISEIELRAEVELAKLSMRR